MKRVFAFIGFSVAITHIILNIIDFSLVALILSVAVVLFAASLLIKKTRQARVIPIVTGSVIFACLVFMLVNTSVVMPAKSLDGEIVRTELQIVDIPEYNAEKDYYTYTVKTSRIYKSGTAQSIKLKMKSSQKLDCDYYDCIDANLQYYSVSDNAFDTYGDYGDSIFIRARLKSVNNICSQASKPVNYYFILLRSHIFDIITDNFRGNTAGLAIALLTGNKAYLSYKVIEEFQICGISHFLAVSGFHISLVCLALYSLLKLIGVPEAVNTVVSLLCIFVYCGISDFSKSAVRAGIMLSVLLISRLLSSKADALNSLGLAVLIICFNPFAVTDAAAVLTVSAMLGILAIYSPVKNKLNYSNRLFEKIDSATLLSACIMLSVVPAMYVFFGNMSLGSLFYNVLIEPMIVVIIISAILFCLLLQIAPLSFLFSAVLKYTAKLLFAFVDYASNELSFLYIDISDELLGIALSILFLFMGIYLLVRGKISIKHTQVFALVLIVTISVLSVYQQYNSGFVTISSSGMVVVSDKDNAVVIGMDSLYDERSAYKLTKSKEVIYIDSDRSSERIKLSDDFSQALDENMKVNINNGVITVNVFDKVFKIYSDCVIINDNIFERNDYSLKEISFSYNSQLVLRGDDNG